MLLEFGSEIHPPDFPPKCMVFEHLNAITLHLVDLKKLETLIGQGLRLFQEALLKTKNGFAIF